MNILITGIAGFVGSTLARKLLASSLNASVTGIDNLSYGDVNRIQDYVHDIEFVKGDVKDIGILLSEQSYDLIIHCAAIAPLPENQVAPYSSIEQNVAMCASVADFATKIGCNNVIFFSSGALYEGAGDRANKESDAINTSLIYPTSKFLAEQLLEVMARTYGINVVAIRLFNLFGPHQDYHRKQPPLLGYLIKSYLKGECPTLFASPQAKRDYIYIDDLFSLILCIIKKFPSMESGEFLTVNAGSGKTYSVYDILSEMEVVVGENIPFSIGDKSSFWNKYPGIFERKKPLKDEYLVSEVDKIAIADIGFARTYFDWEPKTDMNKGLEECIKFAKKVIV